MRGIFRRIISIMVLLFITFATSVMPCYAYYDADAPTQDTVPDIRYVLPQNTGSKSYMDWRKITCKTSYQYALQDYCSTNYRGIRTVNGRYCIAIGTFFDADVGQYVTLNLENGVSIPCIVADIKADVDTDERNIFTVINGCCSEFVIEADMLPYETRRSGDISTMYTNWNSPVYSIDIFNYKVNLEE